jgi:hypothetical protein
MSNTQEHFVKLTMCTMGSVTITLKTSVTQSNTELFAGCNAAREPVKSKFNSADLGA